MRERTPTPRQFSRALAALWTVLRVTPRYQGPVRFQGFATRQLEAFVEAARQMELSPEARARVLRHLDDAVDAARRASLVRDRAFVRYVGRAMRRAAEAATPRPVHSAVSGAGASRRNGDVQPRGAPAHGVDLTPLRARLS